MTITESLLAVFAVGLLLGLWLSDLTLTRMQMSMLDLEDRITALEGRNSFHNQPALSSPGKPGEQNLQGEDTPANFMPSPGIHL